MLPLKTSRVSCKVSAAAGSSAAAPNRVRRTRVQRETPPSGNDAKQTSKGSSADLSRAASSSSSTDGRQRIKRTQSAAPAPPPSSRSSSTTDTSTRARKNPELYSLVAEGLQAATQTHQQQHHQQQQQQSQGPADQAAAAAAAAAAPWALHSLQGVVGSTGAYSGTPQQQPQQQQQWQQLPGLNSSSSSSPVGPPLLRQKPEVLSPAGGWPQLRAAVENGADAVYFGMTGFNARARAANFSTEELPEVMSYLRARGVKGYVALNILVFDQELPELEEVIRHLATAGVDALIVQDIGAVALARRVAPNLPIHGSTQMSITSAEGAEFAASLGVSRVVVGRELSVREIAKVAAHTRSEVEAFCHGALCVSYSGQCFSSEAWGGRSANRGQCAQACRMPYALIVDGEFKSLDDMSYLLSPQDLMALEQLPQMVAAGVSCFKIEGRLKGPEYVAATTAAYRAGVDAAWEQYLQQQQQQVTPSSQRHSSANSDSSNSSNSSRIAPEVLSAMAQVFSRAQDEAYGGLTPGFLEGSRHQRLVRGRAPRHRGLCLGRIAGFTNKGGVLIRGLLNPVKRGDGVVFDQGTPEKDEQGGSVWEVMRAPAPSDQKNTSSNSRNGSSRGSSSRGGRSNSSSSSSSSSSSPGKYAASSGVQCRDGRAAAGDAVELLFAPDQLDVSALSVGDLVWKNRDPAVEAQLRASYDGKGSSKLRKTLVQVHVSGSLGTPLRLQLTDGDGHSAVADTGDVLLSPAVKRTLSPADVVAAIGQLGDNTLAPADINMHDLALDQGLFLPASAWKAVRRAAADQLLDLQQQHGYAEGLAEQPVLPQLLHAATQHTPNSSRPSSSSSEQGQHGAAAAARQQAQVPSIRVLCRTPDQVSAALAIPWLEEVIVDFLEVHGLKEAVAAVKGAGKQVVVALPRILKPDESRLLWFYLKLGADALLLRGAGPLQQLLELGGPGAVVHSLEGLSNTNNTTNSSNTSSTSNGNAAAEQVQQPAPAAAAASRGVTIPRLEGDFSLNAANVLSTDLLLRSGLSRLCPTHDLNAAQLVALAEGLTPQGSSRNGTNSSSSSSSSQPASCASHQLEAVVHQHLPIFHTEHCVFCRFLSDGNDYRDCGHPCESHTVQLRDSAGAEHLVLADMGCRNTVFNASAQSGLHYLPRIAAAGYGMLRVELVNETADFVKPLLDTYRRVLQGRQKPREAWRWLQESCAGGVAAGSLEVKGERAVSSLRPSARRT